MTTKLQYATVHGVLAGAYKGGRAALTVTLNHASLDDGDTALCGKVKAGSLADVREPELTCPACLRKLASSPWIRLIGGSE